MPNLPKTGALCGDRKAAQTLDRYLRSNHTPVAAALRRASPARGPRYTHSKAKRALDIAVGVPAAVLSAPVSGVLMVANVALAPGHPPLFVQDRAGHGRVKRVIKVRSMTAVPESDMPAWRMRTAEAFAQLIRRYHLDELPQLPDVAMGRLSLVGIRVLPAEVVRLLEESWSARRFSRWKEVYESTPLGLTGVHQVYRRYGKDDLFRFHRDVFYATHASLGLDLYLIWGTVRRLGRLSG
jgi:lipopolysaccharide/colanic/teichoic acid biosynthesis glycosyltransferase